MKDLLFICLAIFATSCSQKTAEPGGLSSCLTTKLEAFKQQSDAVTIRIQKVNGETHYWLNTDARTFDGQEYILNKSCDTVCTIGGLRTPPPCEAAYNDNDWEVIWKK